MFFQEIINITSSKEIEKVFFVVKIVVIKYVLKLSEVFLEIMEDEYSDNIVTVRKRGIIQVI